MDRAYEIRDRVKGRKVKTLEDQESIVEFFTNSDMPVGGFFAWEIDPLSRRIISTINSQQLKTMVRGFGNKGDNKQPEKLGSGSEKENDPGGNR